MKRLMQAMGARWDFEELIEDDLFLDELLENASEIDELEEHVKLSDTDAKHADWPEVFASRTDHRYMSVPKLPRSTNYEKILRVRHKAVDARITVPLEMTTLWGKVIPAYSLEERFRIYRALTVPEMVPILTAPKPPTATTLLKVPWRGNGFSLYWKVGIDLFGRHHDIVYMGSAAAAPRHLGAPFGLDVRREQHEDSIDGVQPT